MARETRLHPAELIYPLFVRTGEGVREPVESLPGVDRLSIDRLLEEARGAVADGIGAVLLFGVPREKDARGSAAWSENGLVQRAVRRLKGALPDLVVITDVCLCGYTSHGHCGVLEPGENVERRGSAGAVEERNDGTVAEVANDPTLELLARQAVSHAAAGADVVAPSDMMDGRVSAIRGALDEAGHPSTAILSYAAKYASAFYGPFRDAAGSVPAFGDRRGYQMDPANAREAIREVGLDLMEGADMVMVKPALPYLDVIARVKREFGVLTAAYHVSGEYAMIRAAAERGWIDGDAAMLEAALSIKRAGADLILTYAAREIARRLS